MSQVLSKAQELADAISVSEELGSLREAAERLDSDEIANVALRDFQEKQQVMQRAASSGIQLPDEQKKELTSIQNQIREIPTVQDFAVAQNNFNSLMSRVNDIIAAAVSGVEPGDGGGCSEPGCGCGH
ncbi:MAG: YlbF family regulator [Thermoleophilia bacterium]|nr:YlbF family regulator [Thermoleophilia bacterium]